MTTKQNWQFLVIFAVFALPQIFGAVIDHEKYRNNTNQIAQESKEHPGAPGWLQTAHDVMASPAGHVVSKVAKELINRSAGNSQVLSLNINNLIIIVLLKVLIFAAALLGAGHWTGYGHGYGYGRSSDGNALDVNEGEDYLITGFLAAQGVGQDDCLYASACASPKIAYEYAKAAKALKQGIEQYEENSLKNTRYDELINILEKAAYDGYNGVACNRTAKCDNLL